MNQIYASSPAGGQFEVRYTGVPDVCPLCKHACHAIPLGQGTLFPESPNPENCQLQMLFRCPRKECGRLFIAEYYPRIDYRRNCHFELSALYPQTPDQAKIADGVAEVSPNFVEIMNQSLAAESHTLDQLVGMGLRKALEFLIKDYCVHKHPDKEAEIKANPLGKCIADYISDSNIKDCAARATWLGNDETHYTRVWTDHDISDLRVLIQLTQNWISSELLTQKYRSTMPEPAKKRN
jgi:hypothetical protein